MEATAGLNTANQFAAITGMLGKLDSPLTARLIDLVVACFGEMVERPDSKVGKAAFATLAAVKVDDPMFRKLGTIERFAIRSAVDQLHAVMGGPKE